MYIKFLGIVNLLSFKGVQKRSNMNSSPLRRDPLFVTMAALVDVEGFATPSAFAEHACRSGTIEEQREQAQWIQDGATAEEVAAIYRQREVDRSTAEEQEEEERQRRPDGKKQGPATKKQRSSL